MAQINSKRQLFFEKGLRYAQISRSTGFDVKTVKEYMLMKDYSEPKPESRDYAAPIAAAVGPFLHRKSP